MVTRRKTRPLRDEIAALDQKLASEVQFTQLKLRCLEVEKEYNGLKQRLVSLLLPDQIEAARTCGISPELYALEWIDIHFRDKDRMKMAQLAPGYGLYACSLYELRNKGE